MKNENEFNAFLKKEFKKHAEYKAIKISDRFKIGLPDWLIFHDGAAVAVECKFAKEFKKAGMLYHKVTPPQLTTLKGFSAVKIPALIVIGVGDERLIYVGSHKHVTDTGNITGEVLKRNFFTAGYFDASGVRVALTSMFDAALGVAYL